MAWVYGLVTFIVGGGIIFWRWSGRWSRFFETDGKVVRRWRDPSMGDVEAVNEPPASLLPAAFGVMRRFEMRPEDFAVAIIDLARRGYLQIEQIASPNDRGRGGEWALTRKPLSEAMIADLARFEKILISRVFSDDKSVRLSSLRRVLGPAFVDVQNALYEELVKSDLFREEPLDIKVSWRRGASGFIIGSLFVWVLLRSAIDYPGSVAIAVFLLGVAVAYLSNHVGDRTAKGSADMLEGAGFIKSLQLGTAPRTEDLDRDVFAGYLPWALAGKITQEWATTFGHGEVPVPAFYKAPAWTLDQVETVKTEELLVHVLAFHDATVRLIRNSKGDDRARK